MEYVQFLIDLILDIQFSILILVIYEMIIIKDMLLIYSDIFNINQDYNLFIYHINDITYNYDYEFMQRYYFFLFVIFIMMVIIFDVFFYGKIMYCRDLVSREFKYQSMIIYVVGYLCLFMEL